VNFLPRAKNAKAEIALKLYRQGILLKDIADRLDVPQGTVRRWKSTYKWDSEGEKTVRKDSERSEYSERSEKVKRQNIQDDIASVMANEELTEKQKRFCLFYVRSFNATKAYMKAYGCSYETAASVSYRLLENVGIRNEIQRLKQNQLNRELLSEADIFQKYMDIAFADITDFVEFGQEEEYVVGQFGVVEVKNPETGEKELLKQKVNTVRFRESGEIDGTLISEVKNGRNGASIKLADRMKALDWLADHMDIATEEQKARIAVLKVKSAVDIPDEVDTSYVDTLKELAAKVWGNEEEEN
jgi:phage terminase small subunit